MKNIFNFFKPFLLAPFVLYIFNLMAVVIDIYIPINIITVIIVGLLQIPGFIMLIVFSLFML